MTTRLSLVPSRRNARPISALNRRRSSGASVWLLVNTPSFRFGDGGTERFRSIPASVNEIYVGAFAVDVYQTVSQPIQKVRQIYLSTTSTSLMVVRRGGLSVPVFYDVW